MIDQYLIGSHRNFTYLITFDGESVVVDPQSDLSAWQARMNQLGAKLKGVILTHTHWDHIIGVPAVIDQYGKLPIYLHRLDSHRMDKSTDAIRECFKFVDEGDEITVGSQKIKALHTPGHSVGECSYFINAKGTHLFTGDTVFIGDVGRTDLETGSDAEMFSTLQRLKKLPGDTIVYPGHDYGQTTTSTIAHESEHSPAFRCKNVEELSALP